MIQLVPVYTHVIPEITDLLNVVATSGIDAHIRTDWTGILHRRFSPLPCLSIELDPCSPIAMYVRLNLLY